MSGDVYRNLILFPLFWVCRKYDVEGQVKAFKWVQLRYSFSKLNSLSGSLLEAVFTLSICKRIFFCFFCSCALNRFLTEFVQTFHSFGRVQRQPRAWWFFEVTEPVRERRKATASAHNSDKERQAYILVSQHAFQPISRVS